MIEENQNLMSNTKVNKNPSRNVDALVNDTLATHRLSV